MRTLKPWMLLLVIVLAGLWWALLPHAPIGPVAAPVPGIGAATDPSASATDLGGLPPEALATIALIRRGGPFPHRQDGVVFGNYEHRLPDAPHGYYHEFTVDTPGADNRGARRIVTGGTPPAVWYYTDDHYRSFHAFQPP